MDNKQIAGIFAEMADILDIKGESVFRINAYRKASINVINFPLSLKDIVDQNPKDLEKIPGIGAGLRSKIVELILTGKCEEHEDLKKDFPKGLLDILRLRGIGPKKVKLLYSELRIKDIPELKKAAENHLIRYIPGMGEKSEADILNAIKEHANFSTNRMLISDAMDEAVHIISYMKTCPAVDKIEYAGSLRRMQETVGDIDILVTVKNSKKDTDSVMDHFAKYENVLHVVARGPTKSSVTLQNGVDADLRVVENKSFGASMHYFTGSKSHNVKIRDIAKRKGLKINEYGVFKNEKMIAGKDEKDIFKSVGAPYIIPEIRKDDGEVEYGLEHGKFPKFIELTDIKGDLHCHSTYSDGDNTIEEMAIGFMQKGYEYCSISDHSSVLGVTHGMGKQDIRRQWAEIDNLNSKYKGKFKILKSAEVDILKDGSLDFDDNTLSQLDFAIISAHMYNRLPFDEQTKRLIVAIENPYSKILGHPTGRLINRRAPMEFDMEKIIDACIANNVAIEINSNPQRLDLNDQYVRLAKEKGAKFAINTDSHDIPQMDFIKYGVGIARRGWLCSKDVINTYSLDSLTKYFKLIY